MAPNTPMETETTPNASGNNTNDKRELLSRYTRQPYPKLVKEDKAVEPDDEDDENGYRALVQYREKRGNAPRFHIIDRQGRIYGCGYAYLLGWFFTPPETLSIQTTTHLFTLAGQNMLAIEKALMREKVKELREFLPGHDQAPAAGEPLITYLNVSSRFEESGAGRTPAHD